MPKSKRKSALYSALYPGAGQIYADNTIKGLAFMAAGTGIASLLLGKSNEYNDINGSLDSYRIEYQNATIMEDIDAKWQQYESKVNEVNDIQKEMLSYGIALGITWVANLIDAYFYNGLAGD